MLLPSLKIDALGGSADLSGSATLNDRLDADLHLKVAGMVLEKLLADPALASANAARLDLDFNVAGSLMSVIGKAPAVPGMPLATIGLKDFRLSADDPVNPGQTIDVVACRKLDVAMTEPIVSGKPIVIDKIILDRLVLSAVAVEPGSTRFVGVPNLPARAAPAAAAAADSSAPRQKLGEALRVKTFQLNDAKIIYDPRIAGTQRMCLDQIDTSLNVDPHDPGSYKLSANISRKPVFNLAIDGQVNIDNPGLQNLKLNLQADLTQNQLDFLPPQLQLILRQTRAKAKLNVQAGVSMSMSDPMKGKAHIDMDVQNIDLNQGNLHIPIDNLALSAHLQDGQIIHSMKISALNSVFDLSGSATLNSRLDTDTTLKLTDVELEAVMVALRPRASASTSSTKLNAEIEVRCPVMVAMGAVRAAANEPVADMHVRGLRLTADDPLLPGKPLDFAVWDNFGVAVSSFPSPGKPIVIDRVIVERPAIRAVAMGPRSRELAGFSALQNLFVSPTPAASGSSTTQPAMQPAGPAQAERCIPPGDAGRLRRVALLRSADRRHGSPVAASHGREY